MALAHHSVARKKYEDCQLEFAEIYANRIRKEIEKLDLNMLAHYKNERLEYFLKIDNEVIRKLFSPLEDMLEEKAYERIKSEVNKKLVKIGQELVAASNMSGLNPKDKKRLTSMLTTIESEMQNNSIDDPSMQDLLNNNKDLLEKIREKKIFPGRKESNTTKPVNKTPRVNTTTEDKSNGILNTEPDATIEGLTLYIASLSLAFINREIKKNALNAKLLAIIEDEEMVNLLEMVGVANSKNVDNAFDLSLGINGYLFRFSTLFNDRERFDSKQKRAKRFLTQVNPSNIQAIVNKLS
jgi:vacuolar-type H+-ATPase subunit I/STV1